MMYKPRYVQVEAAQLALGGCQVMVINAGGQLHAVLQDVFETFFAPCRGLPPGTVFDKTTLPKAFGPKHYAKRNGKGKAAPGVKNKNVDSTESRYDAYPERLRDPRSALARDIWDALGDKKRDLRGICDLLNADGRTADVDEACVSTALWTLCRKGLLQRSDDRPAIWSRA